MAVDWEKAAAAKRDAVNGLIPDKWRIVNPSPREVQRDVSGNYVRNIMSSQEVEYTEADAYEIANRIATRQWRAVDVTKAFCHRAALVHQLTNCLLEIFFDAALQQARGLDEYQDRTGNTAGPLHGVPISLKDQLHLPGVETTMGYVGWIGTFQGVKGTGKEKVFESELARELRACGAVFYCKTSVPHTLMAPETINNIVGFCWNAKNRLLSAGGSSGGEGALIGAHGSPLGFGTDIGGSIRIPAAVNGIYGLKPSTGRIPYEGMANSMDGQGTVLSAVGPMATSLRTIKLTLQAVLSQSPWLHDPLVQELPWREDHYQFVRGSAEGAQTPRKLCFGIFRNDGYVTPHPPVLRAVNETIRALERMGHKVIEWIPPAHIREGLQSIIERVFTYDGARDAVSAFALSGEPGSSQVAPGFTTIGKEASATDIAATNVDKRSLQKEYLDLWNKSVELTGTGRPIDAIISPVAQHAASRPNRWLYTGYTHWVNAIDYSSVVVPVTTCDKNLDKADEAFKPQSDLDKESYSNYDPKIYHGTAVSVQVIGRRLQEEKTIAAAEVVDDALRAAEGAAKATSPGS